MRQHATACLCVISQGILGSAFDGYVPLVSQGPYLIIVYFCDQL